MIWYLMDKKDLAAVTGDDEDKNVSAEERNKRALIVFQLKETVCETLGKCWPNEEKTQEKYQLMFVEQCVRCLQNNTRPVQLSVLVALGKFLDRLKILEAPNAEQNQEKKKKMEENECLQKICQDVLSAVVYVAGNYELQFMCYIASLIPTFSAGIPHTGLKKEALNIVLILVKRLIDIKSQTELSMVKKTFEEILVTLQKDNAPEIKCRINDIEDKLK